MTHIILLGGYSFLVSTLLIFSKDKTTSLDIVKDSLKIL